MTIIILCSLGNSYCTFGFLIFIIIESNFLYYSLYILTEKSLKHLCSIRAWFPMSFFLSLSPSLPPSGSLFHFLIVNSGPLGPCPLKDSNRCPLQQAHYSTPANHLMPTCQQEFSLSWGCKSWLLTHKNCQLSLVCQVVSPLQSQCPYYLCSLFWINSLPSEILSVWKFFFNPCLDCLNTIVSIQTCDCCSEKEKRGIRFSLSFLRTEDKENSEPAWTFLVFLL